MKKVEKSNRLEVKRRHGEEGQGKEVIGMRKIERTSQSRSVKKKLGRAICGVEV